MFLCIILSSKSNAKYITFDTLHWSWYTNRKRERIAMPELSRFYNIIIRMLFSDIRQHNKPHFHVQYAEYEASVGIDGELLAG